MPGETERTRAIFDALASSSPQSIKARRSGAAEVLQSLRESPILIAGIVMLAVFLSACAPTPQSLIVGKWEVENAPTKVTAEFSKDGTARLTIFGQTLQGTYKVTSSNELEWTVNGRTTRHKVKVTATELQVTDDQSRTIVYRRK